MCMSGSSPAPAPLTDADYTSANMTDAWVGADPALQTRRAAARKRIAQMSGENILGGSWGGSDDAGNAAPSVGVGDSVGGAASSGDL